MLISISDRQTGNRASPIFNPHFARGYLVSGEVLNYF